MLNYMTKNKEWCNIPDNVVDGFKEARAKTQNFASQACAVAAKVKQQRDQAAAGGGGWARRRNCRPDRCEPRTERRQDNGRTRPARRGRRPSALAQRAAGASALSSSSRGSTAPIGWWLLLLPCWQSSALASASLRDGPNLVASDAVLHRRRRHARRRLDL